MKTIIHNFYYSFPVQLLILHFRKSQVLLFFWLVLFLTISGNFMHVFGANALFLAPEYLGNVNAGGAAITGVATGVFIMSWNITTFILHSRRFRFLATGSKPFLKYCINNAIIPLAFLIAYFFEALYFDTTKELIPFIQFLLIAAGFLGGFFLLTIFSFAYFFNADKRIVRTFGTQFIDFDELKDSIDSDPASKENHFGLPVEYYLNTRFNFKKVRPVGHYSQSFLDTIFKRHHFAAMITVLLAFIFMILVAFFLDHRVFQVPAAASILILFAIMVAVIGALSYFLGSWSLLFLLLIFTVLNLLYQYDVIDPRNKAYGINYSNKERPSYSLQNLESLNSPAKIEADKKNMITILNRWKAKQKEAKPLMVVFNFSGGGVRSASFAMNVLQELDSVTNGQIMQQTFLMTGASGGMLSAAYFRELVRLRADNPNIKPRDKKYLDDISDDLLNPVFSSMIARDLISPSQKFTYDHYRYVKDRGYAFEEKLDRNTRNLLDKNIGFYQQPERNAEVPLMILNSVVTRDLKKMMVCTQPLSFMMQEAYKDSSSKIVGPDAIDFAALFKNEDPMDLRLLTALRMNATYPYILPSVWLPSQPVIDVMDAGLRDNNGQESSLRFLNVFKDWVNENTRGVLIIQVRSRQKGSWDNTYKNGGISEIITKPFTMLQTNWFRLQDYLQDDEISYAKNIFDKPLHRVAFMYIPEKEESGATLNFHLTASEKNEVNASLHRINNVEAFKQIETIVQDH
jgi:energy-coupling factor transporter transmembrane protein EcfT